MSGSKAAQIILAVLSVLLTATQAMNNEIRRDKNE